jgi:hypothetical protein
MSGAWGLPAHRHAMLRRYRGIHSVVAEIMGLDADGSPAKLLDLLHYSADKISRQKPEETLRSMSTMATSAPRSANRSA